MTLFEKVSSELKKSEFLKSFTVELVEQYNEDYKHEVSGILIKHAKTKDFCIFIANLNDSEMRRPIDSNKTYESTVTGVWTPYLDPITSGLWVNEYEFSADDIYTNDDLALEGTLTFIQEHIDSIK